MSILEEDELINIPMPFEEDYLTREILLTHDPDDRGLDSELLLQIVEGTFCSTTDLFEPHEVDWDPIDINNIDLTRSREEPVSLTIHKISNEIHRQCFEDQNLHRQTLALLEMLTHYRWEAKVVLALASFAYRFGLFWLILKQQSNNTLAVLLAKVKRFPKDVGLLKPKFKALNHLISTMIKLTKLMISFEGMFLHHELVDEQDMDIAKSKIYVATYWICRSILVCSSSQVADLRNLRLEQCMFFPFILLYFYFIFFPFCASFFVVKSCVNYCFRYSDRTVIAAWEFHSLGNRLSNFCHDLQECLHVCQKQIGKRLYEKLLHMFKEKQEDNQNALRTLFGSQNEFPFTRSSSKEQYCGILELKNKVVIILITKPELLPIDKVLLLVQQTSDNTLVWIPIPSSNEWTQSDKIKFEFFSSRLPWFSVRRPWSMNSTVIRFIKQEWKFEEDPIMVVLDENGVITNRNAMDMVWIWGGKAFPFSCSREKELWEEEDEYGMVDLMINGINPLLSMWVEEDKKVCIYGSDNIDWIRELNARMSAIKSGGIEVEMVYVGYKNPNENVKYIIDTIRQEKLSPSLTFHEVQLFWLRLESLIHCTKMGEKLSNLIHSNDNKSWTILSEGALNNVIKLDEDELKQCLQLFPLWHQNAESIGLIAAITTALEGPINGGKCDHVEVVTYDGEQGSTYIKPFICGLCKRPMNKFVLYRCEQ